MRSGPEKHTFTRSAGASQRRVVGKRHAAGEGQGLHERFEQLACLKRLPSGQPRHTQQRPGQLSLQYFHGGVLELRLLGYGAVGRCGDGIDASQRLPNAGHAA